MGRNMGHFQQQSNTTPFLPKRTQENVATEHTRDPTKWHKGLGTGLRVICIAQQRLGFHLPTWVLSPLFTVTSGFTIFYSPTMTELLALSTGYCLILLLHCSHAFILVL